MSKRKKQIHLDFETFSELDIKKVGAYKYAQHSSTEVLMAAWKIKGNKTVQQWDATRKPMPAALRKLLEDPNVIIKAFNAQFERLILKYVLNLNLPVERFRCTMVHSYLYSFAGDLATVGAALNIPQEVAKLKTGKELIRKFCKPQPANRKVRRWTRENDPEGWDMFLEYNRVDVLAEEAVDEALKDYPVSEGTWEEWFLDQKINDRGLPIDMPLVFRAIELRDKEFDRIMVELRRVTKLENPNSNVQMRGWLQDNGMDLENMQAATLDLANKACPKSNRKVKKVLTLIQQTSKTSLGKWDALLRATCDDGRLRGSLQFAGAQRTRRWAGRIFQPQNLPRPPKGLDTDAAAQVLLSNNVDEAPQMFGYPLLDLLSACLRSAIAPKGNKQLNVSDLAGIEGRILPWLCEYQDKIDAIAGGLDMYKVAAGGIYHVPYDQVDDSQRFVGKVAELALGYQGAVNALRSMGANYGVEFTEQEALTIVQGWRKANAPIVDFWYSTERAAKMATSNPGKKFWSKKLSFEVDGDFLFMDLPSGRAITYHLPEIDSAGKITHMGWNSYIHRWERIHTYGGKLVENATQAVSRDVLANNMPLAEEKGFLLVGSVHDELLSETSGAKKYNIQALNKILTRKPAWALDLPLGAAGFTGKRYKKD